MYIGVLNPNPNVIGSANIVSNSNGTFLTGTLSLAQGVNASQQKKFVLSTGYANCKETITINVYVKPRK